MALTLDKDALRRRYAEERAKRLRAEGPRQYVRPSGRLARMLSDPFTPVTEREPVREQATFVFIGGGFAGLLVGARLREAGITDVRIIDKAGDFGGTWYWNRYPGAMCDTASLVYMPLLEETGYMPTEKYAHGPEILDHSRRIGRHYGLYDNALFHTEVTGLEWDEEGSHWLVHTDRGDEIRSRFVGMGLGPLHVPKLPGVPGLEDFAGHAFHTSRWDYDYTGGDPSGAPMDRLVDKRVAVIGTGATAVQVVPELARHCGQLYVFQRTPSSVDVRANGPLDPDWFRAMAVPGWQQRWLENFTANWEGVTGTPADGHLEDLVQDGWTDLGRRMRAVLSALPPDRMTMEAMVEAFEDADFEKMEEIRGRVDTIVEDPDTAARLKAWYRQLCKRPCFHDEYLQAFNRPNTHLVDTDGRGVERLTRTGVVAQGREYEVDCVVFASGFEFNNDYLDRAGFDPVGRDGLHLSEAWAEGMRTLHGMQVHGFPNLFLAQFVQGAFLASNIPHNFVESAKSIAAVVRQMVDRGGRSVEPTLAAQDAWVTFLVENGRIFAAEECTPGYYNNEGAPLGPKERLNVGYPAGPMAFFRHMEQWRTTGGFEGLEFR